MSQDEGGAKKACALGCLGAEQRLRLELPAFWECISAMCVWVRVCVEC